MVEWSTKFSSEIKGEDLKKLRDFKLDLISDFMRDIASEKLFSRIKSDSSETYTKKKLESSSSSSTKFSEKTYSIESARKDAERLRRESS
jgi:hypothetical protein